MSVIVGYTTESGNSKGHFGVFQEFAPHRLGAKGGVQLDRVKAAQSLGHAFEIRQAVNKQPSRGGRGASERRLFESRWSEPKIHHSNDFQRVRDAR